MGIFYCDKDFYLTPEIIDSFDKNGFLILKNFLLKTDIFPLQQQVYELSAAIGQQHADEHPLTGRHDKVDQDLLRVLNKGVKQSLLYDRLQQIPGILALPSHHGIQCLSKKLLRTQYVGIWPRIQLRFDLFGDTWNTIHWHHDYMYNRGTEASITFWIPLVQITQKMGPIKIARCSHLQEYDFIQSDDAKFNYTLTKESIDKLDLVEHDEFYPGDICIMHSKTIHSGYLNEDAERARLTCIFRMQDLTQLEI